MVVVVAVVATAVVVVVTGLGVGRGMEARAGKLEATARVEEEEDDEEDDDEEEVEDEEEDEEEEMGAAVVEEVEDVDAVVSVELLFTPAPTALSEEVADSKSPSGRANLMHTMWSTAATAIPFDPDGWP